MMTVKTQWDRMTQDGRWFKEAKYVGDGFVDRCCWSNEEDGYEFFNGMIRRLQGVSKRQLVVVDVGIKLKMENVWDGEMI